MSQAFSFSEDQFNHLFPFYLRLNSDMQVTDCGKSISKLIDFSEKKSFDTYFTMLRPHVEVREIHDLISMSDQMVVMQSRSTDQQLKLRGQFEYFPEQQYILFVGSPWFDSMEQVIENNLVIDDFAKHDPLIDLLHVMKTQEMTNEDLKQLLTTINKQKNDLKAANQEIHEIALFPTQNPDPLLRINSSGDILRTNPVAEHLQSIEFENKVYAKADFFKLIAPKLNFDEKRTELEVRSNNLDFSLVCVPVKDSGYFNIYGRDVTIQNRNQKELQLLSLIIQQTMSAVIITDAAGKIEWVNQSFEKISGYSLDEVKGKKPGEMLQGPETDISTIDYMRDKIASSEPFLCEIYNYKKSGEGYWLRINAQPIFDQAGKVTQFFAIEEDITHEKKAQEKIRKSATRMSSLITNLHAGIMLLNSDGSIALTNQHFCDQFNIKELSIQLIGKSSKTYTNRIVDFFAHAEDFEKSTNKILKEKRQVRGEILELKDGRYIERDFIPIWNEKVYDGCLWMYTDITERVNADKKLQEQRSFYERILDNIPSDIAVFDAEHRYLYLNPQGIKDDELRKWIIGKKDEDYVLRRNKPFSIVEKRRAIFNEILESKQLRSWEEKMVQSDGTEKYVIRNMYPVLNENNDVSLVIGYGVDITEIKNIQRRIEQSEKRFRDVIDNSLAVITTHDLLGNLITVNPMASKLYGYEEDEMIGHSLKAFMPAEDQVYFEKNYLAKIIKNKHASGVFRIVNKEGKSIYTLYNNYLKEEEGQSPYIIAFAVDISDRIKAEKELKEAKKITEELARTKQNFLANMSHEIRTPMNAIMGMANQLNKTGLTKDQQFYLNTIRAASENLLIIINDILDLSKIEEGKFSLEHIGFDPKVMVSHAIQVMHHKAEEKGLSLSHSSVDPRLSQVLIGDPHRLNQVLLNLLSNAIKFTNKGSVSVTCSVVEDLENSQTVQVDVTDTGIGIEEEFQKKLFEKFSQEDVSITRKFGGTGLGMSISKDIVLMMGGDIFVSSKKGVGTTVSFIINFKKGSKNDLPVRESENLSADNLKGRRILITDDNEMNRLVASTILNNYGVIIEEAVNGNEAIEKIKKNQFDLVLMDIQMPEKDGVEATLEIREKLKSAVPIIALTALAIKGDEEKFIQAGMNGYLSKPFDERQLLDTVIRCLQNLPANSQSNHIADTSSQLYDLGIIQGIAKDNDAFLNKMIHLFMEQAPKSIEEIKSAYKNGDFEKVRKVAHRLKPSIDNMGITALKAEIREVEKHVEVLKQSESMDVSILRIENVLNQVVNSLKNIYQ